MATFTRRSAAETDFGDDLMGVHGDVLFADPLGIRNKKVPTKNANGNLNDIAKNRDDQTPPRLRPRAPPPPRQASPPRSQQNLRTPNAVDSDDDAFALSNAGKSKGKHDVPAPAAPSVQPAEEEPGMLKYFLGGLVAGGMQCCSMRDRARDADAAKTASAKGRPPEPKFPAPAKEKEKEPVNDVGGSLPSQPPAARKEGSASPPPARDLRPSTAEKEPPLPPPASPPPAQVEKPPDTAGHSMGNHWTWPPWCLMKSDPPSKEAQIEVWVEDDERPGKGRWVKAEPQSRVVNKAGHDAYLCAEYEWDDDFFVQDFGPEHVRRRGSTVTIFQLYDKGTDGVVGRESQKEVKKKRDTGAGVMSFLKD